MKNFNLKGFLIALLVAHAVVYLLWCFIYMDAELPIKKTFTSIDGRGSYIAFLLCVNILFFPWFLKKIHY